MARIVKQENSLQPENNPRPSESQAISLMLERAGDYDTIFFQFFEIEANREDFRFLFRNAARLILWIVRDGGPSKHQYL